MLGPLVARYGKARVFNDEVNATATLQLLAASRRADVPRFVYVSSSEVYGGVRWAPTIRWEQMTEDHPAFPCTVYGGSKLAGGTNSTFSIA